MKKILLMSVIAVLIFAVGFAGWQIYRELYEYSEGKQTYEGLEQFVEVMEKDSETSKHPATVPSDIVHQTDIDWPKVDFAALQAINSDIVGWIYIEGTAINYPIVQGDDKDDHRIFHLWYCTKNKNPKRTEREFNSSFHSCW